MGWWLVWRQCRGDAIERLVLLAVALGHASSYLALAAFAAAAYVGLNAVTTAHRAMIPENFGAEERAAATGGEEVAMLAGVGCGLFGSLEEASKMRGPTQRFEPGLAPPSREMRLKGWQHAVQSVLSPPR